ncbi:MAG: hypothetical protein KGJ89_02150 [Patescibacteria group bacterium]|nr:hypothetical protein [Patescibacteria group bacterium]MDE2015679.1 hypothetical protein [Patescibacteria group bacterium]MDE2226736.1 hypothetical protein [Patescibacteria group bacterium]
MVHVRSAGVSEDLPFREGMTAQDALREAGVRKGLFQANPQILVGPDVANGAQLLKDEDTVTVSPKIKNGG